MQITVSLDLNLMVFLVILAEQLRELTDSAVAQGHECFGVGGKVAANPGESRLHQGQRHNK